LARPQLAGFQVSTGEKAGSLIPAPRRGARGEAFRFNRFPTTSGFGIAFAWNHWQEDPSAMISAAIRSLSRVPIPLRSLAVCVACEECFELGEATCPSCGSDEHVPLLHLLEGRILNLTGCN